MDLIKIETCIIQRNSRSEQLVQLLHPPLQHVSFAEVLTQGHIGQLSLFPLNFQQTILYGVFNDKFDGCDRACLSKTVL